MSLATIALGANLGDPAATLRAALGAIANLPDSRIRKTSALYRTAPIGITEQPVFVNAVALMETELNPKALLNALLDIERRFGRVRGERNGPRTLDLDILFYDDIESDLPELTLPHPRLHLRAFVLQPLADVFGNDFALPGRGCLGAWLPAVANQGCERL